MILTIIACLSALAIIVHCVCIAAALDVQRWDGHIVPFVAYAVSTALLAGGAIGYVLAFPHAGFLLLVGVAGRIVFDRRREPIGGFRLWH